MSRKLRIDPLDGWHHLMNRGVDKNPIFLDDPDRAEFGRCIAVACRRFRVEVHAYCLMDNHFHLLVRCPEGRVSEMMQLASGLYATYFNQRHHRVGHLFGGRFCSRLVTTAEYIAVAVRYIHRNALAVAGIDRCSSYRWSSHRTYLGERVPADFIHTDYVMQWFENPRAFDTFVGGGTRAQPTIASAAVSIPDLVAATDLVILERSTLAGRAILAQRRAVLLEIARQSGAHVEDQMLAELGVVSRSAVNSAKCRARHHLERHPDDHVIVAAVHDLCPDPATLLDLAS